MNKTVGCFGETYDLTIKDHIPCGESQMVEGPDGIACLMALRRLGWTNPAGNVWMGPCHNPKISKVIRRPKL